MNDEPESETSEGSAADAVIEALMSPRPQALARRQGDELDRAILVATRLLRYPGVQREITAAALSDPEVLDALGAREPDLGGYLVSQGFAARGLLPGPSAEVSEVDDAADAGGLMSEGQGRDPLVAMVDGVVRGLEWAGARVAGAARRKETTTPRRTGRRPAFDRVPNSCLPGIPGLPRPPIQHSLAPTGRPVHPRTRKHPCERGRPTSAPGTAPSRTRRPV